MKNKINVDMFFNILDAFDFMIQAYEEKKRKAMGLAIATDNINERKKHLEMCKQFGDWAMEAHEQKKAFTEQFEADT